jgi:hypothetical protein
MVGQDLKILNSDPLSHNVKIPLINYNEAFTAQDKEKVIRRCFKREGAFAFYCDIHPWMNAHAYALKHPFGVVTGADGKFTIDDVPPGKYTISVFHERVPGLEKPPDQVIEIKPGEKSREINFTFKMAE